MKTIISLIVLFLLTNPFTLFAQSEYDKLVEEGLQLLIQQNISAAIVKYETAYKLDSTKVEAIYGLGVATFNVCKEKGEFCEESIFLLDKTISINDQYRKAYYFRGACKALINDLTGALFDFDKAIKIDPKNGYYYYNRAFIKIKLGNLEKGCDDLRKSCDLGYNNSCEKLKETCKL